MLGLLLGFMLGGPDMQGGAAELAPFTPVANVQGDWSFTPDPRLPNVLLLGDSISIGYTRGVRKLLAGRANVYRPMDAGGRKPANCGDTRIGLANLDTWLGETPWAVIHFNWGLWDLCYRNPAVKTQGNRDKAHGTLSVPIDDYARNLDQLVSRLEKTGARLIGATTTVVPDQEAGRFTGDEVRYNERARLVLAAHRVAVDDLYALTRSFAGKHSVGPGDVHYTPEGYALLAEQVAAVIATRLPPADR